MAFAFAAGQQQMGQVGGYGNIKPQQNNANRATPYGGAMGGAMIKAEAGGAGGNMRPGDWNCPKCQNHNYANRMQCNKCGAPKAGGMGGGMGKMGGGMMGGAMMGGGVPQGFVLMPAQAAMAMQGMGGMGGPQMRPGDWQCRACNNHNFASRESCNKCDMPKSTFISKTGLRPGDWICTACQNHNYASKAQCNKCQGPKTEGSMSQKGLRPGDWICQMCSNHNYANREVCNKCQGPKPPQQQQQQQQGFMGMQQQSF